VICGGEDDELLEAAVREARLPGKAKALVKKLEALLPGRAFEIDCAWAGTFAETADGLPFIGPHGSFRGGFLRLGYGGNGITFGLIAARFFGIGFWGGRMGMGSCLGLSGSGEATEGRWGLAIA